MPPYVKNGERHADKQLAAQLKPLTLQELPGARTKGEQPQRTGGSSAATGPCLRTHANLRTRTHTHPPSAPHSHTPPTRFAAVPRGGCSQEPSGLSACSGPPRRAPARPVPPGPRSRRDGAGGLARRRSSAAGPPSPAPPAGLSATAPGPRARPAAGVTLEAPPPLLAGQTPARRRARQGHRENGAAVPAADVRRYLARDGRRRRLGLPRRCRGCRPPGPLRRRPRAFPPLPEASFGNLRSGQPRRRASLCDARVRQSSGLAASGTSVRLSANEGTRQFPPFSRRLLGHRRTPHPRQIPSPSASLLTQLRQLPLLPVARGGAGGAWWWRNGHGSTGSVTVPP